MAHWLFDSRGAPVAFVNGDNVFSDRGRFLGKLDGEEVWNGRYVGEIRTGDRFLRRRSGKAVIRGRPGIPGTPGMPGRPGQRGAIGMPGGYEDVDDGARS